MRLMLFLPLLTCILFIATPKGLGTLTVLTVNVPWNDTDRNFVEDCDSTSFASEGFWCTPPGGNDFHFGSIYTLGSTGWMHGWYDGSTYTQDDKMQRQFQCSAYSYVRVEFDILWGCCDALATNDGVYYYPSYSAAQGLEYISYSDGPKSSNNVKLVQWDPVCTGDCSNDNANIATNGNDNETSPYTCVYTTKRSSYIDDGNYIPSVNKDEIFVIGFAVSNDLGHSDYVAIQNLRITCVGAVTPAPTYDPTQPSEQPTKTPSKQPSNMPSGIQTSSPTEDPTSDPTVEPTTPNPTSYPTFKPTFQPTLNPTFNHTLWSTSNHLWNTIYKATVSENSNMNIQTLIIIISCLTVLVFPLCILSLLWLCNRNRKNKKIKKNVDHSIENPKQIIGQTIQAGENNHKDNMMETFYLKNYTDIDQYVHKQNGNINEPVLEMVDNKQLALNDMESDTDSILDNPHIIITPNSDQIRNVKQNNRVNLQVAIGEKEEGLDGNDDQSIKIKRKPEMENLLIKFKLNQYYDKFDEFGWDDINLWKQLIGLHPDDELNKIFEAKTGHKFKFIQKVKQEFDISL